MTQNIYDDDEFFTQYAQLTRSQQGLDGAPEWPALRALVADVRGLDVLDLGCGYGWFCRWARAQGAARVVGIDVSEKMLARAADATADPAISYARADMEHLTLPGESFHLVYSSLALHYIEHLGALLGQVCRSLVPGGRFVCSVEHPIFMTRSEPDWIVTADGRKRWLIDRYLEEGPRSTEWLGAPVVKHYRTIGTYVTTLLRAGLILTHLEEWGPTDEQIAARPALAEDRQRPEFVLMAARRDPTPIAHGT